jgi:hypothetical protein
VMTPSIRLGIVRSLWCAWQPYPMAPDAPNDVLIPTPQSTATLAPSCRNPRNRPDESPALSAGNLATRRGTHGRSDPAPGGHGIRCVAQGSASAVENPAGNHSHRAASRRMLLLPALKYFTACAGGVALYYHYGRSRCGAVACTGCAEGRPNRKWTPLPGSHFRQ